MGLNIIDQQEESSLEELEDKNITLFNLWNKMGDSYFRRHYPEDERMSDGELFKKYSGFK